MYDRHAPAPIDQAGGGSSTMLVHQLTGPMATKVNLLQDVSRLCGCHHGRITDDLHCASAIITDESSEII